jgi:hypothetical protein
LTSQLIEENKKSHGRGPLMFVVLLLCLVEGRKMNEKVYIMHA